MNLMMADVSHIDGVTAGDEVVLLGRQGDEAVTAEELADLAGTITYEVVTWPRTSWHRVEVDEPAGGR
jgi:alanine racemase